MAELGEANIGGRMVPAWLLNLTAEELDSLKWHSNPNLLDNWYFGNPVNQRGQTEYTALGYTIDRWKLPAVHKLTVQDSGIKITCNSSAGANFCFQQLVENLEVGNQYTLSALITENTTTKGVSLRHGNSGPNTITGTGVYAFTFIAASADLTYGVGMQFNSRVDDNDNYFALKAIKLELGSQQTLAHQENGVWVLNEIPDYGEQLRRCQRYFVNFNPYKMSWFAMPPAVASTDYQAYSAVTLPVAMRAQPGVSYGGNIVLSQEADHAITGILVSGETFTGNSVQLRYDVGAGTLTANSLYRVQGNADPTSFIWLSADL